MAFFLVAGAACRVPPPKNVEPRKLALGAEVTWQVSNDCGARVLCVKEGASSVDAVTADASDVIDVRQVSGTTFTVRGAKVGVSRVVVQLRDATGAQRTATAWLEVKELTRSTVSVRCEQGPAVRRVFAVAPGAGFDFTAQGFGGDDELDTGALPLFEAPGFTVQPTASGGRATAPMEPGSWPWTLVGGATLDVRVYDAATATVSLRVEPQRSEPRPLLLVELSAGEDPVCIAGAPFPATLSVTSGACFPVVSGVTLRGTVPLEVGRVRSAVELEGDGQPCTVSVRLPDGRVTSVTASPPRVGVGAVPRPGGAVLDPTGVEVNLVQPGTGVVCTDGLSDGRCSHIYDGDCYVDSDWVIEHGAVAVPDAGTRLGNRDVVGVGLRTSIRLRVVIAVPLLPDIVVGPPKNLTFRTNHLFVLPGRAAVQNHRCPAAGTDKWHSLSVTPEASGSHHFEFRAENLNDVGTLSFDAYDVTRVTWRLQDADRRLSTASTTEVFVGSTVTPTAGYESAGGRVLRGEGPLRFSADSADGGSKLTGPAVFTGDVPHVVNISSPLAGPAATVLVRDATAITGVGNFDAQSVKVGGVECAGPFVPLGVMGRPVLGRVPVAPVLEVQGEGLRLAAMTREGAVCFAGATPGTATLTVTWGAASVTRTWQVVP
ncbi:MAG: hypothetical protein JNJ54_20485 [Myxococcaceae bacterium]|nr:hypothetical protein [Myxococcaceae bacterium]